MNFSGGVEPRPLEPNMSRCDSDLGAALSAAVSSGEPLEPFPVLEEGLLALFRALHKVYSSADFQAEVREAHAAAAGKNSKLIALLAPLAARVQDPVFEGFGFPAGPKGVMLMKRAAKLVAERSLKVKKLSGDLRELLGLEREEVPQPLFAAGGAEETWESKAVRYRNSARKRFELLRQQGKHLSTFAMEDEDGKLLASDWKPVGPPTFFPDPRASVKVKTPMGSYPDLFDGDPSVDRSFGSPAMMITDRYEMNVWLARGISAFDSSLGKEVSSRLFEDGASGRCASKLKIIYIAGVEGTGHHGFGPMLMYPAVCEYGEGTVAWWRSLREVLMKTPPHERRAKLRTLMRAMSLQAGPGILFEWASLPSTSRACSGA